MIVIGLFVLIYIFFGVITGKIFFILIKDKDFFGEYFDESDSIQISMICGTFFPIVISIVLIVKIAIKLANKIIEKF